MNPQSSSPQRLRVLLIAEAANPKLTSVALIGWQFASALAQVADVHLVSEQRNAADILGSGPLPFKFTAINNRFWQGGAWRIAKLFRGGTGLGWGVYTALAALVYPIFEWKTWRQFRLALRQGQYDVVHRITPNSPIVGSVLAVRCAKLGIPFVLGPINGGVPWPRQYPHLARAEREWLSPFRRFVSWLPGYLSTRRAASAILLGSRYAQADLPSIFRSKALILSENAVDADRFVPSVMRSAPAPLQAVFVGRLVPLKGVDLLLQAIAPLIKSGRVALRIVGDGPDRARLTALAATLGIAVDFVGWVPQSELPSVLQQCHVFAFPSLREFGGGVVLEAMSAGLVPLVLDYGGPCELVPADGAFVLPMGLPDEVQSFIRSAFESLLAQPGRLEEMGQICRRHVLSAFTWRAKARQSLQIYDWVLGRSSKPRFSFWAPVYHPPISGVRSALLVCPGSRSAVSGLSRRVPLVLLPFLGKPFLGHWLDRLAVQGCKYVRLLVSDRSLAVSEYVQQGARWGLTIDIVAMPKECTLVFAQQQHPGFDDYLVADHDPLHPELRLWDGYRSWLLALEYSFSFPRLTLGMQQVKPGVFVARKSKVAASAVLHSPCWIGPDVYVGDHVEIGPHAVLEQGVYVDRCSRVFRSVVGPGTYVGAHCDLIHSFAWGGRLLSLNDGHIVNFTDPYFLSPLPRRRARRSWRVLLFSFFRSC